MNPVMLAAGVLSCPDCGGDLSAALQCQRCGRQLGVSGDGIVDALPQTMHVAIDREALEQEIGAAPPGEQARKIVLYEEAFHDSQAAYYDKLFAEPLPMGAYYKRLIGIQIFRFVRNSPFVVDLCCGTGKSSLPLLEKGLTVVGIDVSREMLRVYHRKCKALGLSNVLLVHADASRPPLRHGACAAITLIGGLHHIQEQAECLRTCANALAEGGVLAIHEPLQTGLVNKWSKRIENLYALLDPKRVMRALARRLHFAPQRDGVPEGRLEEPDFTPFERPFSSPGALQLVLPPQMKVTLMRSQGLLSFCAFPPTLQGRIGRPLAWLVAAIDHWLSGRQEQQWRGDTIFMIASRRAGPGESGSPGSLGVRTADEPSPAGAGRPA
jgi:SAM-dependent methyltransferase